eukprot:scaffold7045_cov126-Isochrysis_galbana.AAC.3
MWRHATFLCTVDPVTAATCTRPWAHRPSRACAVATRVHPVRPELSTPRCLLIRVGEKRGHRVFDINFALLGREHGGAVRAHMAMRRSQPLLLHSKVVQSGAQKRSVRLLAAVGCAGCDRMQGLLGHVKSLTVAPKFSKDARHIESGMHRDIVLNSFATQG